ncbi:hypothetical protein TYRP_013878 [Tyrophagus putrescentiae]|nr:hypothetical protein TYRP_013878 [Tyrophagus putrescentiae]
MERVGGGGGHWLWSSTLWLRVSTTGAGVEAAAHQGVELRRVVADDRLEIADELVDEALAVHLGDHVAVVVVAQRPRQLLVVHRRLVLPLAPQLGDRLRVHQLELRLEAGPLDVVAVLGVGEQLQQELPQLNLAVVAGAVARRGGGAGAARAAAAVGAAAAASVATAVSASSSSSAAVVLQAADQTFVLD